MKDHEFYQKYANTPLGERLELLSNDFTSPLLGMTLNAVYQEIKGIDDKIRPDIIRKEKLLTAVAKLWLKLNGNNKGKTPSIKGSVLER